MVRIKKNLSHRDFIEMEKMERKYYSEDFVTDAESSFDWYLYWSKSTVVATYKNKIAGFMNIFPISDSLYYSLLSGSYDDSEMVYEEIKRPDDTDDIYHLFLSCVVIDKAYRDTDALCQILREYVAIYDDFNDKGYSFQSIITQNVTAQGVNFSTKIGMIPTKIADNGSTICIGKYEDVRSKILELIDARRDNFIKEKVPKHLLLNFKKRPRFKI